MNIAELFVSLGVKGDGEAKKALKGVDSSLSNIKSMSIEAKAALVAVVYGLQNMMSSSMKTGMELSNFNAETGLSTQRLEQYNQALKRATGSGQGMADVFKQIQMAQAKMKFTGTGLEQGTGALAARMKNVDQKKFFADPEYLLQTVSKFAQDKTIPIADLRYFVDQMGLGSLMPAFRKDAFNEKQLARGVTHTTGEVNALAKTQGAFSDMEARLSLAFDKVVAKFGPTLIPALEKLGTASLTFATAVLAFEKSVGLIEKVADLMDILFNPARRKAEVAQMTSGGALSTATDIAGWMNSLVGLDEPLNRMGEFLSDLPKGILRDAKKHGTSPTMYKPEGDKGRKPQSVEDTSNGSINNINNTYNFEINGKDSMETATKVKEVVHTFNLYPKTQAT